MAIDRQQAVENREVQHRRYQHGACAQSATLGSQAQIGTEKPDSENERTHRIQPAGHARG